MANLLNNVLSQYEERFGEIGQGSPEAEEATKAESH